MEVKIPFSLLPTNKILRREILDKYFPSDLIPFEELTDGHWKIIAFLRGSQNYFVDPLLEKSLENWIEPLTLEKISFYWKFYKNSMLSFHDSWSILYWSMVLNWLKSIDRSPKEIIVFHIDDHKDFDTPLLTINDSSEDYSCIFTKEKVSLQNPLSIHHALQKKSIGIGSFITPLFHEIDSVNFLHLRYAHEGDPKECGIETTYEKDSLLAEGAKKPALQFVPNKGQHKYYLSSDPSFLVQRIQSDQVIFLHIDCDGFNNRYNSDDNWSTKDNYINLGIEKIKLKIKELFSQLGTLSNPIYMNCALSPDFFPSEYWEEITTSIFTEAEDCGIVIQDELSHYLANFYPKRILYGFYTSTRKF